MPVTTEQFNNNPRSKNIREISLAIMHILNEQEPRNTADLISATEQLKALGVQPNMHMGLEQSAYNDPVVMSEYAGGQILHLLTDLEKEGDNSQTNRFVFHPFRNAILRMLDAEEQI